MSAKERIRLIIQTFNNQEYKKNLKRLEIRVRRNKTKFFIPLFISDPLRKTGIKEIDISIEPLDNFTEEDLLLVLFGYKIQGDLDRKLFTPQNISFIQEVFQKANMHSHGITLVKLIERRVGDGRLNLNDVCETFKFSVSNVSNKHSTEEFSCLSLFLFNTLKSKSNEILSRYPEIVSEIAKLDLYVLLHNYSEVVWNGDCIRRHFEFSGSSESLFFINSFERLFSKRSEKTFEKYVLEQRYPEEKDSIELIKLSCGPNHLEDMVVIPFSLAVFQSNFFFKLFSEEGTREFNSWEKGEVLEMIKPIDRNTHLKFVMEVLYEYFDRSRIPEWGKFLYISDLKNIIRFSEAHNEEAIIEKALLVFENVIDWHMKRKKDHSQTLFILENFGSFEEFESETQEKIKDILAKKLKKPKATIEKELEYSCLVHRMACEKLDNDEEKCSRQYFGKIKMSQRIYECLTCKILGDNGWCLCEVCAKKCHVGHEVKYLGEVVAFCDCPEFFEEQGDKCKCNGSDGGSGNARKRKRRDDEELVDGERGRKRKK